MTEYQITLVTDQYRGDHSADVRLAVNVINGETVDQLVSRVFTDKPTDVLEIRLIRAMPGKEDD